MSVTGKYDDARLDFSDLQVRDFSKYFLSHNPFPAIPTAEEDPEIIVDRERAMKLVADITKEAFRTGKSQTLLLLGDHGNGKSHTLMYVKSKVNTQLMRLSPKRAVAIYVPNPGADVRYLYAAMVDDLGFDFLQSIPLTLVAKFLAGSDRLAKYIYDEETLKIFQSGYVSKIRENPLLLREYFNGSKFRVKDVYSAIVGEMSSTIKYRDYLLAVLQLTDSTIATRAWRWLLGEAMSRQDRQELGLEGAIEDRDSGLKSISTLRLLLSQVGYEMIYILMDEIEAVSGLTPLSRSHYYDDLRHMIDQNTEGLCIIMSIAPAGWATMREGGHPLARRLMINVDWLESFNANQTAELVYKYIDFNRNGYLQSKGLHWSDYERELAKAHPEADPKLYPFSPSSIRATLGYSKGIVSETLRLCKKLMDEGSEKGGVFFENEKIVETLLKVATTVSR